MQKCSNPGCFEGKYFVLFWVNATVGGRLLCCVYLSPGRALLQYLPLPASRGLHPKYLLPAAGKLTRRKELSEKRKGPHFLFHSVRFVCLR